MRKLYLLLFLGCWLYNAGQNCKSAYASANCPAKFKGGEKAMLNWLEKNRNFYPPNGEERVVIKFTVDSLGKTCDISILRNQHSMIKNGRFNDTLTELENDAIRLVQTMPEWIPAKIGNNCTIPVNYLVTLNLRFQSKNFDKE